VDRRAQCGTRSSRAGIVSKPVPDAATVAQAATTNYLQIATASRTDIAQIIVAPPVVMPR